MMLVAVLPERMGSLCCIWCSPPPSPSNSEPTVPSQHLRLCGILWKGSGGPGEGCGGHVHSREDEIQAREDLHGVPQIAEVGSLPRAHCLLRQVPLRLKPHVGCVPCLESSFSSARLSHLLCVAPVGPAHGLTPSCCAALTSLVIASCPARS